MASRPGALRCDERAFLQEHAIESRHPRTARRARIFANHVVREVALPGHERSQGARKAIDVVETKMGGHRSRPRVSPTSARGTWYAAVRTQTVSQRTTSERKRCSSVAIALATNFAALADCALSSSTRNRTRTFVSRAIIRARGSCGSHRPSLRRSRPWSRCTPTHDATAYR